MKTLRLSEHSFEEGVHTKKTGSWGVTSLYNFNSDEFIMLSAHVKFIITPN